LDRELEEEKSHDSSGSRFDARCAAGRPAKKTAGSAPAVLSGTQSIREACAPLAYNNGLRPNAYRAVDGLHILTGMRSDEAAEQWIPRTSDTMSGYERQSIICRDGHSATAFLTLQLS
jgi:hypothetical protein